MARCSLPARKVEVSVPDQLAIRQLTAVATLG
jgi:hypothetical protein